MKVVRGDTLRRSPVPSFLSKTTYESSCGKHLFKCFSDGECAFQEVNFQTGLKKKKIEIHTSQHNTHELSWMNKTTWAASCTYLHHVSPQSTSKDCALGHFSRNWFVIGGIQEGSKGQLQHFSYRPRTGAEPESPLNLWSHWFMSECDRSQSPGPGWFTASSSCYHQYWFISNLCLCTPPEAHWLRGITYYPLQARE